MKGRPLTWPVLQKIPARKSWRRLLREAGEDTVDGSHPIDLGFMRYADILTPIQAGVLPK